MKKTVKIIAISLLIPAVAACGFLDENMNTHYSGEDVFGSEQALEAFVNGCYSAYATSGFYGGAMCEWLAPASAIVHWGLNGTPLSDAQKRWLDCLNLTILYQHFQTAPWLRNIRTRLRLRPDI